VGCLAELGYAPEVEDGEELLVVLRPCPYEDLAAEDPGVVCQLHLGLIRGVLGEGDGLAVTSLLPWVTPTRCEVHLEQVGPAAVARNGDAEAGDAGTGDAAHAAGAAGAAGAGHG
jgi:predicted ArsR family transcriptional regulator